MKSKELFGRLYDVEEKLKENNLSDKQVEVLLKEREYILEDLKKNFNLQTLLGSLVGCLIFGLLFFYLYGFPFNL